MNREKDELSGICQLDNRKYFETELGKIFWVKVEENYSNDGIQIGGYFSMLVPSTLNNKVLETHEPENEYGYGLKPRILTETIDEKEVYKYFRYGNSAGFEPFIIPRRYSDSKLSYFDINEEFRLLFNLYHDSKKNTYLRFHDDGVEEEIIRINNHSVYVKLKELRQFLCLKDMFLCVYINIHYCLEDLGYKCCY